MKIMKGLCSWKRVKENGTHSIKRGGITTLIRWKSAMMKVLFQRFRLYLNSSILYSMWYKQHHGAKKEQFRFPDAKNWFMTEISRAFLSVAYWTRCPAPFCLHQCILSVKMQFECIFYLRFDLRSFFSHKHLWHWLRLENIVFVLISNGKNVNLISDALHNKRKSFGYFDL